MCYILIICNIARAADERMRFSVDNSCEKLPISQMPQYNSLSALLLLYRMLLGGLLVTQ